MATGRQQVRWAHQSFSARFVSKTLWPQNAPSDQNPFVYEESWSVRGMLDLPDLPPFLPPSPASLSPPTLLERVGSMGKPVFAHSQAPSRFLQKTETLVVRSGLLFQVRGSSRPQLGRHSTWIISTNQCQAHHWTLAEAQSGTEEKAWELCWVCGVGKELRPTEPVGGGQSVPGRFCWKIFWSLLCCSSQAWVP